MVSILEFGDLITAGNYTIQARFKNHINFSSWVVGAGFFFLRVNPLAFVGCILLGLSPGLIIAPIISKCKD